MQGPAPQDDQHPDAASDGRGALSPDAVDALLADLGSAARQVLAEAEAVEQRMEELTDADEETMVRDRAAGRSVYAPTSALASARARLSAHSALGHRETARAFVSWWADAATVALVTAACHAAPHEVRMVAANPEIAMDDEDLTHLPKISDHSRQLVELGAHMHDNGDGLYEMVADLAVRSGVRIGRDARGAVTVYEDGQPDARRHRLWGNRWADHQVPTLPTSEQLTVLLGGAPADVLARLHAALAAIDATLVAKAHAERLSDKDGPWTPAEMIEYDQLSAQVEGLTRQLAQYAQAAADCVPAARALARRHETAPAPAT
ncbi:hypothetical protein H8N00_18525, partial [Streptomyces sp. AC563]|uniref:hypothetical protein n=1 Tax=Streptomyces buecherae TaxID=2763006 RepID=UPI001A31591A|nr:hypothetical protein [Streptomyces buecherae]MBC3990834.1 hypothetical protein [Streptomyces buecherae]